MQSTRVALVTGANRGIGLEVARQLAEKGHTVILTSRDAGKGQAALQSIQQPNYQLHFHPLDVTDHTSIHTLKEWVSSTFGRLDILVNNAGINYDSWHNVLNADLKEAHETLEANLFGPWYMSQAFIPLMQSGNYGRIVNVSSGAGALNEMGGGTPAYSISKAGLNVLTIKLAAAVSGNFLVNAVCPGWVRTDMGGSNAPRSVAEGAASVVWAAVLPESGPSGGFFRDGKPIAW